LFLLNFILILKIFFHLSEIRTQLYLFFRKLKRMPKMTGRRYKKGTAYAVPVTIYALVPLLRCNAIPLRIPSAVTVSPASLL